MAKKITVSDFIKEYITLRDKSLETFWAKHIVRSFIPIEEKTFVAENIVKATTHITVGEGENQKRFYKVNSIARHFHFRSWLIELYTDINISASNSNFIADYNALDEKGLVDEIIGKIPEKERDEIEMLMYCALDDVRENERDVVGYIESKLAGLGMLGEGLLSVAEKLASDEKLQNKLTKAIEKMAK